MLFPVIPGEPGNPMFEPFSEVSFRKIFSGKKSVSYAF